MQIESGNMRAVFHGAFVDHALIIVLDSARNLKKKYCSPKMEVSLHLPAMYLNSKLNAMARLSM